MGRAGSGGHSGGHSSGSHSSSHSSSVHHVGSSHSRPMSSGSSSGFGGSLFRGSPPPLHHGAPPPPRHHSVPPPPPRPRIMPPPPPRHYGAPPPPPVYHSAPPPIRRRRYYSILWSWLAYIVVACAFIMFMAIAFHSDDVPKSTVNREKVETGVAFHNNCIVDELGWFDNVSKTEKALQNFYNKTGVQPYIVLFDYNADLKDDSDCETFADEWYRANIDNEGTLLFAYFAAEDTDNDVGTMVLINGKQISSVMDAEATEIFWAYTDEYWYSDLSTDDMFIKIFDLTADRIMDKSTTGADVAKIVAVIVLILAIGGVVVVIMNKKRADEKARNEETERILNTKVEATDSTLNKYL